MLTTTRAMHGIGARLGWLPMTPPLIDGPATNRQEAAPWSVPRLPFSCTRRPNSEKVISRTRPSWPVVFNVPKKPPTASASSASSLLCAVAWSAWVSKPSRLTR